MGGARGEGGEGWETAECATIDVYIYIYIYICMYVCMYAYMYVCIYLAS